MVPKHWLTSYKREWLRPDVIAGITVAVVVIPKAMAFAAVAGLPVQVGLYTALAAMVAYPLLGTSRPLSISTTSALAMMTASATAIVIANKPSLSATTVASTLAVVVGGLLLLAWVLRLGFLANFISEPVLIGFQAAVGVVIITSQFSALLGAHGKAKTPIPTILELPQLLMDTHALTLAVSVAGIAVLVLLPRFLPKIPAPLVWIALSVIASAVFGLGEKGVGLVGKVPASLPPLTLPDLSIVTFIWPIAAGIALMSFVESVATARSFSVRDDPPIDANRELLALAASNAASGFTGGMAASGVPSPTTVAEETGTRSQMAQWVSAAVVLVTVLFFANVLGVLPKAALAAVIVVTGASLIKPKKFMAIARVRRLELTWAIATLVGSVLWGLLEGVIIAVIISVLMVMHQAAQPAVYAVVVDREKGGLRPARDDEECDALPGLLILRIEGRLLFANVANAAEKLRALVARSNARVITLECSAIIDIEYTALVGLQEAEHNLRQRGVTLWLAAVNPGVMATIERSPLKAALGPDRIFRNAYAAMAAFNSETEAPAPSVAASEQPTDNAVPALP